VLGASLDIDWSKIKQYGSILVEAVLLLMSAAGISVSPGAKVVDKAVEETAQAIKTSSKLQEAMEAFVKAWNKAGGSAYQKAKALFFLIKDSNAGSILKDVVKAVCSNMSWFERFETVAKVVAMIAAAVLTDGAALIAEIALVALSAVDFAKKIANLNQLEAIKKTL
jgi:hypothetical protein